jgi:hypothetical protein
MADKEKSAELILKLYELRREEVMRKARNWFFGFNPESFEDVTRAAQGPDSAYYRMVTTYWDMACSFVNLGAIDEEMFNAANQEHNFVYAKVQPFIEQIRANTGPQYLAHLEQHIMRHPEAETRLAHLREMSRRMAAARSEAAAEQTESEAANA